MLTFRKDEWLVVSIWEARLHEGEHFDNLGHAGPAGDAVSPALVHQPPKVVRDLVDSLGAAAAVLGPLDLLSIVATVVEWQLTSENLPHDDGEAKHVALLSVVVAFKSTKVIFSERIIL